MIFVLDNYDSFVYNLVQVFGELGENVTVIRNDAVAVEDILAARPSAVVVSPGPCTPVEAGISVDLIRACAGFCPVLGVCLGHQAIAEAFGGVVVRAREVVHGKTSRILHDGRTVFQDLSNPFTATRYHSLIVRKDGLPDCLAVTAWTEGGDIMGIRHRLHPVEGVQFHPESILTGEGKRLLTNFLDLRRREPAA